MLHLTYRERLYGIQFKYNKIEPMAVAGGKVIPERRSIECRILTGDPNILIKDQDLTELGYGIAVQDSRDLFEKETGRRKALKVAIDCIQDGDARQLRTTLWNAYWDRIPAVGIEAAVPAQLVTA